MAAGTHLFPFRTQKLSLPAPMVLGPQGPGRVGRRRTSFRQGAIHRSGPLPRPTRHRTRSTGHESRGTTCQSNPSAGRTMGAVAGGASRQAAMAAAATDPVDPGGPEQGAAGRAARRIGLVGTRAATVSPRERAGPVRAAARAAPPEEERRVGRSESRRGARGAGRRVKPDGTEALRTVPAARPHPAATRAGAGRIPAAGEARNGPRDGPAPPGPQPQRPALPPGSGAGEI